MQYFWTINLRSRNDLNSTGLCAWVCECVCVWDELLLFPAQLKVHLLVRNGHRRSKNQEEEEEGQKISILKDRRINWHHRRRSGSPRTCDVCLGSSWWITPEGRWSHWPSEPLITWPPSSGFVCVRQVSEQRCRLLLFQVWSGQVRWN